MVTKLQAKTKEELVGELVETRRRLGELEEADSRNQQTAASLLESAKLFRTIADNAVDAIISGDKEGKITYWNKAATEIFGYANTEIVGQPLVRLIPEQYREAHKKGLRRVVETGETKIVGKTVELDGLRRDGTEFPLELSLSMAPTREGPVFTVVARDISMRKQMEMEVHRTRERMEKIFNSVSDAIVVTDLKRKIVDCNNSVERIFGFTKSELMGNITEVIYPDREAFELAGRTAMKEIQERGFSGGEITLKRKDGSSFPAFFSASLLIEANGRPTGSVVVIHDLTGWKETEEELLQVSRQNEQLLNSTGEGIYGVDVEGNATFVNPAALQMTGYGQEEVIGVNTHALWHHTRMDGSGYPEEECPIYATYTDGTPRSIDNEVFWRKDGSSFPVEYTVRAIFENDKQVGTVVSFQDITERRKAEKELKLNLERIKKITAGMTKALATAAEIRDPYTAGHQQRVTDLAVAIAREMRLTNDQIDFIRTGGILHDVGKISVPAEILTNPRKLTTLELDMVKEHSQYSYEILKEAEFPWPVADLVAQHHERLDGSGYPGGIKGDEIMLEAKILAVADVVEAMSSHRPYRPALGIEAAMEEISEKRGKLYEPKVVDACLRLLKEKKFSFKSIT